MAAIHDSTPSVIPLDTCYGELFALLEIDDRLEAYAVEDIILVFLDLVRVVQIESSAMKLKIGIAANAYLVGQ